MLTLKISQNFEFVTLKMTPHQFIFFSSHNSDGLMDDQEKWHKQSDIILFCYHGRK